jgi:hypothetical protein
LLEIHPENRLFDEAEPRTQRAVDAIVAYLRLRPLSADTEHGIAQWWLPEFGMDLPLADVRAALDRLVRDKVMEQSTLPDGRVIYRAMPAAPATR